MPSIRSIFFFALPLLGLLKLNIVGELYIHEVVMIATCFWIFISKRDARVSLNLSPILLLLAGWFISQVMSDVLNDTSIADLARGWLRIIFFAASIYALSHLLKFEKDLYELLAGSAIALAIRAIQILPDDSIYENYWKFGVGAGAASLLTIVIIYLAKGFSVERRIQYAAIIYLGLGGISFFLNARSFAGVCIFSSAILFGYQLKGGRYLGASFMAVSVMSAICLAIGLSTFYSWGASTGVLGDEAQTKYAATVKHGGGLLEIMLGGRSEPLISTLAIADAPLLGHGSWAKSYYYYSLYMQIRQDFSEVQIRPEQIDSEEWYIPAHSHLLGTWVESGLLGAIFWLYLYYFIFSAVVPAAWVIKDDLGLIILPGVISTMWTIGFSPFGANARFDMATILSTYIFMLARRQVNSASSG